MTCIKLATLLVLGSLSCASQAATYSFGNLLSGEFQPSDEFATLDVDTVDNRTYSFTLQALDLNALFNAGAFIRDLAVDLVGSSELPLGTLTGFTNGITSIDVTNGGGPGGDWEQRYVLGSGSRNRLTAGESVSWIAVYDAPISFQGERFGLHVQGLSDELGGSAWYTPIPEPQTYALLLAGLGLLGYVARRRPVQPAFGFARAG